METLRPRRVGTLLTLLLGFSGIALAADPPEYTYRTTANEVRLTFSATDQSDHGVATLQPGEFAIVDKDFIVRDFQSFTRSDWTKLEIAILIDASESVTPGFKQEIAGTIELMSQKAGVPEENISVFSFQGLQPARICASDCRATHAIDGLPARTGGFTPLFDTVVFASDFLAHRGDAHSQKVLILFTDGEDTISHSSLTDATQAALDNDVQIFSIDLGYSLSGRGSGVLHSLATTTGGRYYAARDGAAQTLKVILERFRATYTVSYRLPTQESGFHTVRILPTHNLNLQFHSRSGYFYPTRVQ